jgi:ABC-2 type transport system permease protein
LRAFFRNRQARFFTLALPVLFLVIFASVFTGTTKVAGRSIDTSLYYVPVIITLTIIRAAFGNLGPRPGPYFYTLEVV